MAPDICVVMNARSGRQRARQAAEELPAIFDRLGLKAALRLAGRGTDPGALAEAALREGFGTIVAGGGDGTLSAVAGRLAGSGRRMGVLPLGTFNYFARSFGIPADLEGAARVIAAGHERLLDLAEVSGRVFLNNASLGAYAAILEQRERVYHRWGRSQVAAHVSVLLALLRLRPPLTLGITVDGVERRCRTPLVFVARNAFQLEQFGLAGTECLRAGGFAVYLAPECGRAALLRLAVSLALRRLKPERDFELICGHDLLVQTRRRRRVVVRDGERERLPGPYRFRLRRGALRLLVPEG